MCCKMLQTISMFSSQGYSHEEGSQLLLHSPSRNSSLLRHSSRTWAEIRTYSRDLSQSSQHEVRTPGRRGQNLRFVLGGTALGLLILLSR